MRFAALLIPGIFALCAVVGQKIRPTTAEEEKYRLNLTNLVQGIYLLQLTDAKGRKFMFKFVKE